MFKKISSVLAVITILILLVSSFVATTVFAQEDDPGDASAEGASAQGAGQPFEGTGELADGANALAGPGTTAPGVSGDAGAESVIGADGRTQVNGTTVYPNRAIVYLLITWSDASMGSCTGWFIGPNDVATAAHCIYNTTLNTYATSIVVYPGRNGGSTPYGSTTMNKRWVPGGWITNESPTYDYGLIQTVDALGNTVGWFGYRWQTSNAFPGKYTVRGYPGDKPTATLWTMNGLITAVGGSRLWYQVDTFGGQSGSPVYHKFDGSDAGTTPECCYGIGIHTYGTSVPPNFGNSATRITKAVFNALTKWRNTP